MAAAAVAEEYAFSFDSGLTRRLKEHVSARKYMDVETYARVDWLGVLNDVSDVLNDRILKSLRKEFSLDNYPKTALQRWQLICVLYAVVVDECGVPSKILDEVLSKRTLSQEEYQAERGVDFDQETTLDRKSEEEISDATYKPFYAVPYAMITFPAVTTFEPIDEDDDRKHDEPPPPPPLNSSWEIMRSKSTWRPLVSLMALTTKLSICLVLLCLLVLGIFYIINYVVYGFVLAFGAPPATPGDPGGFGSVPSSSPPSPTPSPLSMFVVRN